MAPLALEANGLSKSYGGVRAVDQVDLALPVGSRTAVIGPNGAGKSTLLGLLAGTVAPSSGVVRLGGRDVSRLPVHARARAGLVKSFQHTTVFGDYTCGENIAMMVRQQMGRGIVPLLGAGARRRVGAQVEQLASSTGLDALVDVRADALSHGDRRALDLAMALALRPRVILLDEPTAGMSAAERQRIAELLTGLPRTLTFVIIEHDLDLVFSVAERVVVMALGAIVADGSPDEVRESKQAQESYVAAASTAEVFVD